VADVERLIIAKVVRDEDMAALIEAKINDDFFVDEEHLGALTWMRKHWSRYGKSPGEQAFKAEFPTYKLPPTPEPMPFYLDSLKRAFRYDVIGTAVQDASDALSEDGDPDAAEKVLSTAITAVASATSSMRDHNLTDAEDFGRLFDFYDSLTKNPGSLRGISSGFPTIDLATMGFQPGQLVTFVGPPKAGKAQETHEKVLTPVGWCETGDLKVGDEVIGSDGRPTPVLVIRRWSDRPLMRVTSDDGGTVLVDAAHEWTVHPHGSPTITVETQDMARRIITNRRFAYLPVVEPVHYTDPGPLSLHPYLLGVLLGDGSFTGMPRFCKPEPWMHTEVERLLPDGDEHRWDVESRGMCRIVGGGVTKALRSMGLYGCRSWEKFVPDQYLRASVADRRQLLAGLLDTDGGVEGRSISFCSTSERMAGQVRELVLSLGGTARIKHKPEPRFQNGRVGRPAWVVTLRLPDCPFRLPRKRQDYENRPADKARPPSRRVVEVVDAGRGETVCIQVAATDGLYVTEDFLVTHNSTVLLCCADAAERAKVDSLLISFEMSYEEMVARWVGMRASLNYRRLLKGMMNDMDRKRLTRLKKQLTNREHSKLILSEDITSTTTVGGVVAKIQQHRPKIVFIDGVYLMDDENGEAKGSSQAITNITRSLKRVGQTYGIPVVITTQALLSKMRGSSVKASSIGYSSSFGQDSDTVIAVEPRENVHEEQQHWLKVLLSRSGPQVEVEIDFDWTTSTFTEFAQTGTVDDPDKYDPDLEDSEEEAPKRGRGRGRVS
jgi:replicative DNA helicase